jgi:hypothetical protein
VIYTISAIQETITMDFQTYAYVIGAGIIYLAAVIIYNYVKKPREYVYDD